MKVTVPYMNIPSRMSRAKSAVEDAVQLVLNSGQFIGGDFVRQCEREVADLMGFRFGVGVDSGTSALRMALQAVGIQAGDEVILPAVSFVATYESVVQMGAVPVIVDVQENQPLICNRAIEKALTKKTKAIVPVHLFGDFARVEDFGVTIVDDAAQALGSKPVSHGEIAALSFYPTKIIGGLGDGGMVLCRSKDLADHVHALGNHGLYGDGGFRKVNNHIPGNARLDALQAAAIHAQLPDLTHRIRKRREIAERYDTLVGRHAVPRMSQSNISVYTLRHPQREKVKKHLLKYGVQTAIYYPVPLSEHPLVTENSSCPNANRFCQTVLALPCHSGLSESEVEQVLMALDFIF